MKYDLKSIMLRAWKNYRKYKELSFAECLHRAWITAKAESINSERIERAKVAAGIQEVTKTWSEWKKAGYEVIHGSKALFGTELIWGSKGDGAIYKARFFWPVTSTGGNSMRKLREWMNRKKERNTSNVSA